MHFIIYLATNSFLMKKVFLGGTCNGPVWRDALIKDLKIDYFHPCADDWTPDMMKKEIEQRVN